MLEAGLTLPEAIQALVEKESRDDLRHVLQRVSDALLEGASFSAALTRQPEAFPALYVATIRASEKSGDLAEALARYVRYQQQIDAIRAKVIAASVYPALLLAVGALVAAFLVAYVVPRFSAVYDDLGRQLPWITELMLGFGRLVHDNALVAALAVAATAAALLFALAQPRVRAALLRQLWRVPRVRRAASIYDLARLYRTLSMLLRSGMPIVAAMRSASGLLRPEPRARLALALADIRRAAPSRTRWPRRADTPVALRMLRVGERSGRMGEMMERIAALHDEEIARWVDWFTRLFEPILMARDRRWSSAPSCCSCTCRSSSSPGTCNDARRRHDPHRARRSRAQRRAGGCSTCSRSAAGCDAGDFTARLAGTLGYRACHHGRSRARATRVRRAALRRDASRRGCAPLRGAGGAARCSRSATRSPPSCAPGPRSASPSRSHGCSRIRGDLGGVPRAPRGRPARDGRRGRRRGRRRARREPGAEDLSLRRSATRRARWCSLVNSTLYDALKAGASDIHLETLRRAASPSSTASTACCRRSSRSPGASTPSRSSRASRCMAELDIAERRVPQDGRFKVAHATAATIDFRVSIMPSIFGEDAVLRILDKQALADQHPRPHARSARLRRRTCMRAAAAPGARALRHAARDRPDRQRQDHHALRRDLARSTRPGQDHHHRGPGRVPAPRACCRSR